MDPGEPQEYWVPSPPHTKNRWMGPRDHLDSADDTEDEQHRDSSDPENDAGHLLHQDDPEMVEAFIQRRSAAPKRKHARRVVDDDTNDSGPAAAASVRRETDKQRHQQEVMRAPSINIVSHGGAVVHDDGGETLVVVPPRVDVRASYGAQDRYGNRKANVPVGTTKSDWVAKTPAQKHDRDVRTLNSIIQVEGDSRVSMSSLVVKIGLGTLGKSPVDVDRIFGMKPHAALVPGTKFLAHIPILPPYEAFAGPIRPELRLPRGDSQRYLPQPMISVYYVDNKASLNTPCIDGFEELLAPKSGVPFDSERIFNVRSSFTARSQSLWTLLSARDIHMFNTLHDDLVVLSGVSSCLQDPLPAFSEFFNPLSLLGAAGATLPFSEQGCAEWASAHITDEDNLLWFEQFVRLVASLQLPVRSQVLRGLNGGQYAPRRERAFPAAAIEALLALLPATVRQALTDMRNHPTDLESRLSERAVAFLGGYADWRYFALPDLVAGCLAIDFEIAHPDLDPSGLIICPANERAEIDRTCKVSRGRSLQDPSLWLMFQHFVASYDHWATSLLLFNMVCSKKEYSLSCRAKRDQSYHRRWRLDVIPYKVASRWTDVRRVAIGIDIPANGIYSELATHVKTHCYADVYRWRRYHSLCHTYGAARKLVADALTSGEGAPKNATQRMLLSMEGVVQPTVYKPAKKIAEGEFGDPQTHAMAIEKANKLNNVVFVLDRARIAHDTARVRYMDQAVAIFDGSFDLVPLTEALVTKAHRVNYYNDKRAMHLIIAYMKQLRLFPAGDVNIADVTNFVVGQRNQGHRMVRYSSRGMLLAWNLTPGGVIANWLEREAPTLAGMLGRIVDEPKQSEGRSKKNKRSDQ